MFSKSKKAPRPNDKEIDAIAQTVHSALQGWARANGQDDIPDWSAAEDWMKASTRESVVHVLDDPNATGEAHHDQWVEQKKRDGWSLGPTKDKVKKTHPMMVPFKDLPDFEKKKDLLVQAIVGALR